MIYINVYNVSVVIVQFYENFIPIVCRETNDIIINHRVVTTEFIHICRHIKTFFQRLVKLR